MPYGERLALGHARHHGECSDPTNAPAMGQHLWLDMTPAQIDALSVPAWQKIILRAMSKYGMYVGDNGGSPWALQIESGDNHTSFGEHDPWIAYAQSQGITGSYNSSIDRTVYNFNLKNAVDWGSKLKVLEPGRVEASSARHGSVGTRAQGRGSVSAASWSETAGCDPAHLIFCRR